MSEEHSCDSLEAANEHAHYGPAVDYVYEKENGELWVTNGEYSTRVNYCPFCGYEAENKITEEDTL